MAAGILGRIEWFRNHNFSIVQQLKKYYKRKKFQKYARIHQDLSLCARSDCWADKPGMITIGAQCEIFGTLYSMGDGRISIGDHTCIYERSIIGSANKIEIGNCVIISNQVHIYDNNNHPTDPVVREKMCMEGFHTDAWRWTHSDSKPIRFLYNGIIIKHQKTEPTYTKTSLFLCEKRRFFMARREKGVVPIIYFEKERGKSF